MDDADETDAIREDVKKDFLSGDEENTGPKSEKVMEQHRPDQIIMKEPRPPSMLPLKNQNGASPDERRDYVRRMTDTSLIILSKHGEVRLAAIGGGALETLHIIATKLKGRVAEMTGDELVGIPYTEEVKLVDQNKRKWRHVWRMERR